MHPCPFCHAPLPQDVGFCPTCGQQIQWVVPPQPPVELERVQSPPASILSRELSLGLEAEHEAVREIAHDDRTTAPPYVESPAFRVSGRLPDTDPYITETNRSGEAQDADEGQAPRVVRVAPIWRRGGAWIIDAALLSSIVWGFLWMATGLVHRAPPSRLSGLDWLAETVLSYGSVWLPALGLFSLITVGYLSLFTALGGQTPGKRLFGLQVVDASGAEPTIFRSAVRAFLALGSGLLVLMGFLLVLFDRRRQTLHDKLARTFVICQN